MPDIAHIRALLQWYVAMGVDETITATPSDRTQLILPPEKPKIINIIEPIKKEPAPQAPAPVAPEAASASLSAAVAEARAIADRVTTLDELRDAVSQFDACPLKKMAKNTVFGDGNPASGVMLIGEAPGEEEDRMGIPFCGPSGQLLDDMLRHIGLTRAEHFYITNTVFWRPPGNRLPTAEETAICKPLVEKHIALIHPSILILVGGQATKGVLDEPTGITVQRTKSFKYKNQYIKDFIHTRAIFHPSYLLRQPLQKKLAWFDLLSIQDDIRSQGK